LENREGESDLVALHTLKTFGIIKSKGAKRVVVDLHDVEFEVDIPLEEVRELLRMMFPWRLGIHVHDLGSELVYRDATPLHRTIVYLLARRGGATVEDAQRLALSLLSSELVIVYSFTTRLRWCRRDGSNCRRVLDAFSKIARAYLTII